MDSSQGRKIANEYPILMSPDGTPQLFTGFSQNKVFLEDFNEQSTLHVNRTEVALDLYGGAIKTQLPILFDDMSNLREIPDHQEVFVDRNSETSVIFEILEPEQLSNEEIARFHFRELADQNESQATSILCSGEIFDQSFLPFVECSKCVCIGTQKVSKFRAREDSDPPKTILILLVVLRLSQVQSDLLITMNIPFDQEISPDSLSFLNLNTLLLQSSSSPSSSSEAQPVEMETQTEISSSLPPNFQASLNVFREALAAFRIEDWALFA